MEEILRSKLFLGILFFLFHGQAFSCVPAHAESSAKSFDGAVTKYVGITSKCPGLYKDCTTLNNNEIAQVQFYTQQIVKNAKAYGVALKGCKVSDYGVFSIERIQLDTAVEIWKTSRVKYLREVNRLKGKS